MIQIGTIFFKFFLQPLSDTTERIIPTWLTPEWILSFFDERKMTAQRHDQQFIYAGIGKESPFDDVKEGMILGFPPFIDWVREMQDGKETVREVPRGQRFVGRPSLDDLFDREMIENKKIRNHMIRIAHIGAGYSQKKIAEHTGLHYTWVSKIINGHTKL